MPKALRADGHVRAERVEPPDAVVKDQLRTQALAVVHPAHRRHRRLGDGVRQDHDPANPGPLGGLRARLGLRTAGAPAVGPLQIALGHELVADDRGLAAGQDAVEGRGDRLAIRRRIGRRLVRRVLGPGASCPSVASVAPVIAGAVVVAIGSSSSPQPAKNSAAATSARKARL